MNNINSDTIPQLDTDKYSGLWYEIMKLPFKWEEGCTATTAEYARVSDLEISVVNTCFFDNTMNKNKSYSRKGYAQVLDMQDPGKLRVEFNDGLPSDYIDPDMTNYWIHYLEYDKYSVVGTPTGEQVWLLSRKNEILQDELDYFYRYIGLLGYDNKNLQVQSNIKII